MESLLLAYEHKGPKVKSVYLMGLTSCSGSESVVLNAGIWQNGAVVLTAFECYIYSANYAIEHEQLQMFVSTKLCAVE